MCSVTCQTIVELLRAVTPIDARARHPPPHERRVLPFVCRRTYQIRTGSTVDGQTSASPALSASATAAIRRCRGPWERPKQRNARVSQVNPAQTTMAAEVVTTITTDS